jgi:hypothetical protein
MRRESVGTSVRAIPHAFRRNLGSDSDVGVVRRPGSLSKASYGTITEGPPLCGLDVATEPQFG